MDSILNIKKSARIRLSLESPKFSVSRKNGLLSGWTKFFSESDGSLEAQYFYVLGQCDYIRSVGFESGTLGSSRKEACAKKNKKNKITHEFDKYRFFSLERGFYSIRDLVQSDKLINNTTKERILSIDRKLKDAPKSWVARWCYSSICGCMGCINKSGKKYVSITKNEHEDYLYWLLLNAKDHEI